MEGNPYTSRAFHHNRPDKTKKNQGTVRKKEKGEGEGQNRNAFASKEASTRRSSIDQEANLFIEMA